MPVDREDLELDARRAGIDDEDRVHGGHAAGSAVHAGAAHRRRATATAQEAMRVRTESAREVRMIGTRAPSTMPAASAFDRKIRFFASMLPASRSGTTRICARPATVGLDALDPRGFRIDRVVEGKRAVEDAAGDLAAVRHLAQARPPRWSTGFSR